MQNENPAAEEGAPIKPKPTDGKRAKQPSDLSQEFSIEPANGSPRNRKGAVLAAAVSDRVRRILLGVLACIVVFGIILLLIKGSELFRPPIQVGELTSTRTVFVVIDQTDTMKAFGNKSKDVVKNEILPRLGPGDHIECYQIGSEVGTYDEDGYCIFGAKENLPLARSEIAQGNVALKDLEEQSKEELRKQWELVEQLNLKWDSRLEQAPPPANKCCSAYLEALEYIGKRFHMGGEKWLIIIGDMYDEPALANLIKKSHGEVDEVRPPEPQGEARDRFSNVKVRIIRPSGTLDAQTGALVEGFWRKYFSDRGADQLLLRPFNDELDLAPTRVPRVDR